MNIYTFEFQNIVYLVRASSLEEAKSVTKKFVYEREYKALATFLEEALSGDFWWFEPEMEDTRARVLDTYYNRNIPSESMRKTARMMNHERCNEPIIAEHKSS